MARLSEMQSSQDSNGEAGTSSIDELSLWVDVVGGKKKGRVFGLGGAAGLVGNGSFGGSLPKSSYWEKKFEEQVKKTEVMEERLMKMEELIRSLQIPPSFQQRVGGKDKEVVEEDTDESSSEDETSEDDET
ncbi:hypothetical protein Tsubulata_022008 [Turnera subulata]|uniref:Uncharacterized protein n=1 Tax=Turnera subulata TaxID=218843 RepID=A0A9Q0FWU6_9ROSI|nr:hypothetical protein Tsubulata_022008 [Turnera subulata]